MPKKRSIKKNVVLGAKNRKASLGKLKKMGLEVLNPDDKTTRRETIEKALKDAGA